MYDSEQERKGSKTTVIVYLSIFVILISFLLYSARHVLFTPWNGRTFISAVSIEDKIYVFGGINRIHNPSDDIFIIDPDNKSIKKIASLPDPAYHTESAAIGGRIFIAGGQLEKEISDWILMFDPSSKKITQSGRLPGPRVYGSLIADNRYLYYIGGWDGDRVCNEILRIDPVDSGIDVIGYLPEPLQYLSAEIINGKYTRSAERRHHLNTPIE